MTTSWQSIIRPFDSTTKTLLLERLISHLMENEEIRYDSDHKRLYWVVSGDDILLPF